ncbi:TPA: guanylate kinase [Candidatus Dependentiae bacterium]|nr:MAG: Guanylate kinase [candidate division TM6 bacterium GW2011_GWE2_31_21]KKP53595.1 MAG: Guanylate kinase [candidate division TM6 bacterium GW2011_GWF2_33_332]HBS48165.1 guanylate kinase [Candidatus Dependentiae bacterium]HBZ73589.1 guanylate kinase [Candidatus Dependentiae bacterium]
MNNQNKKGKLIIISAPSGAGKTSLSREIIKRIGPKFNVSKVITYTSRHPRPGEVNGVDYHFISPEKFKEYAQSGNFLESTNYSDKMYASPSSIESDLNFGKSFILVLDREGAKHVAKLIPSSVMIWITVPSIDELKIRMEKRGGESPHQIEKRLEMAEEEIKEEEKQRAFKYHLVNKNFDESLQDLTAIITQELS